MEVTKKGGKLYFKEGQSIFLLGLLLITLTDSIGSILSRQLSFDYTRLTPISHSIYFLIPFFIAKKTNFVSAVLYASLLGLFDASIGWWLSNTLKANNGNIELELTPTIWAAIALFMMITSAFWGLIGALAAILIFRRKR